MELAQFIKIYTERCRIFFNIIKNIKEKESLYIQRNILNIIKKNFQNSLPVVIPDNDLMKLSEKISKDYTKHTLTFFSVYDTTNKFIRFLNTPLPKKYIEHYQLNEVKIPIIRSNFLANIEKFFSQNIVEDYHPNKISLLKDILIIREFFNKNYPINIYGNIKHSKYFIDNLQNAILFSLLVNSFISFNDIINKINSLTFNDINLKIGFLNFKNKNNQSIRYFIDFYTLFLIKILVQHLNYHKLPLKLKKTKKPFHLTAKSFNFWLEQLCNKTGITVAVTLSNLIKVAGTLSSFIFPPFIVALLKRKLDYTSFDIQIIERIKKGNYPDTIAYDKKKFTRKASIKTSSHKVKDKDIKKEIKLLHRFYTILDKNKNYSENKKKILKHVKKIKLEEHSLSFNLLIEWLLYNLSKKRKRLRISTIKEYFSGFYKDFLELTYEFSLDELDEEEIEQIIEHLFLKRFFKIYYSNPDELTSEDINLNKSLEGKSVGKIKAKIKNFFLFYKQIHNPNLNEDIFYPLEIFKGKSLVRTYLITPGEFENFLNTIKTHPRSNFLRIISSLAFYGGLRKSEILNLKFKDIVFGIEDYIYIRKSKTYSGKRKIPICYLFPDKFLNDFKNFHKDTFHSLKKEERKKKVIELKLFDNDIYNRENFLEDINFLIYALKKYFKNNKLVFHSLRHCFASWLILNFFLITRPKFRFFLLQLFENKALLGLDIYNTEKLKKFFIPNEQNLSAFALWKISMVIGHISPEETLSSYIHILEIYLGYFYWNIFHKEENFSRFFGKFNSKRIIGLIPSLNNDRSIRKAGFKRVSSGYSFIDIMKYLDKKLKL